MAIDYERLKNWKIPVIETSYTHKDTMLYAIAVGLGSDPVNAQQLRFVYENELKVLPTMATILGHPGLWIQDPAAGVTWQQVLHGEQSIEIHEPLAPAGHVAGRTWVDEIVDKGREKGALIYQHRTLTDVATGRILCTLVSSIFCRADGGFGGPPRAAVPPHPVPAREPDVLCDLPTLPQSALLYRLNGDFSPGHVDPEAARNAGFERPILHGLCTFGTAGHALLKSICDYEPERVRKIAARFSSPVYPGETIRTEIWRDSPNRASFRCRVSGRETVVLNNGLFEHDD
ncbi:3-alpha,7-alpha,12-alpha-trihydroxy-5-beta-cholest-24-enoyl-CoA hydratase [Bradyrhizobium sp. CCBAU 11445]|uniref:MaoC/PaaZ C-terminal domain-containing protein n=1 Tax=Bradyrhizobium sp. CCBAU 11445 TaxID=1630896 RepID=UPI002306AE40|nr:MaoC/PaaZ C-terminal domain-containing protein [Bradyrhizobium sp. CCBAU 11445]MDA9481352.1 3-alpha,7-alpha,12-alpha-trihydroxy-5-beta-cholest-24-enoyl-CoA hydratase [Bradyrhizobium sp. CCBAU 11445]